MVYIKFKYSKKNKIAVVIGVVAVLLVSVMLVSFITRIADFGEDSEFKASKIYLDNNINLYQNSSGAYVKNINGQKYTAVTSESKNDYIYVAPDSNFNFKSFVESNHNTVIFGFNIIGNSSNPFPSMKINAEFDGLDNDEVKKVSLDFVNANNNQFSAVAASLTGNSSVIGSFESSVNHFVEFIFTKTTQNIIIFKVRIDDEYSSSTYNIGSSDMSFKLKGFKISLDSDSKKTSFVRVHGYSIEYIPSLLKFPAEEFDLTGYEKTVAYSSEAPEIIISKKSENSTSEVLTVSGDTTFGRYNYVLWDKADISAYVNFLLFDSANSGTPVVIADHEYIEIEFDIFDPVENDTFNIERFDSNLISRFSLHNSAYTMGGSKIQYYGENDTELYALNSDKSYMSAPSDILHVKYLIKVDQDDVTNSVLQVYFNDVIRYDSSVSGVKIFSSSSVILQDLRFCGFTAGGSFAIDNLKVCTYEKN